MFLLANKLKKTTSFYCWCYLVLKEVYLCCPLLVSSHCSLFLKYPGGPPGIEAISSLCNLWCHGMLLSSDTAQHLLCRDERSHTVLACWMKSFYFCLFVNSPHLLLLLLLSQEYFQGCLVDDVV